MVNTVRVNAYHGSDINPLVDNMTKLRNFIKGENRDFSAFRFLFHLMFKQALSNLIVCLMVKKKLNTKVAQLQWILGRFFGKIEEAPLISINPHLKKTHK